MEVLKLGFSGGCQFRAKLALCNAIAGGAEQPRLQFPPAKTSPCAPG